MKDKKNADAVLINQEGTEVLKVLVGSHAHGLARPESDKDFRGVYVAPTTSLLRLTNKAPKGVSWIEGETDDTSYEIAHFLHLATKSNPSILEVFTSPLVEATETGLRLREMLPYVWSSKGVYEAFTGYSRNQLKKMMDENYEDKQRQWKYAVAYIRVLLLAQELLAFGTMTVRVSSPWEVTLRDIRAGRFSLGQVIDIANEQKLLVRHAFEINPDHQPDFDKLNTFLLNVRRQYWNASSF